MIQILCKWAAVLCFAGASFAFAATAVGRPPPVGEEMTACPTGGDCNDTDPCTFPAGTCTNPICNCVPNIQGVCLCVQN